MQTVVSSTLSVHTCQQHASLELLQNVYTLSVVYMPYQTIPVQQSQEEDQNKPRALPSFDLPFRELAVEKHLEPKARWNEKALPGLEGKGGQVCEKQDWNSRKLILLTAIGFPE